MPSLADLLGLAPTSAPWNSNPSFPSGLADASGTPWWLRSVSPPSSAPFANSPNIASPADLAPNVSSGGWLGDILAAGGTAKSPTSGGILQGAVPDEGQYASSAVLNSRLGLPLAGLSLADWTNRSVSSRLPAFSQWSGVPNESPQSSTRFEESNRSGAPLFLPQISTDPWGAPIFVGSDAAPSRDVALAQDIPTSTPALGAQGPNGLDVASPARSDIGSAAGTPSLGTGAAFGGGHNRQWRRIGRRRARSSAFGQLDIGRDTKCAARRSARPGQFFGAKGQSRRSRSRGQVRSSQGKHRLRSRTAHHRGYGRGRR